MGNSIHAATFWTSDLFLSSLPCCCSCGKIILCWSGSIAWHAWRLLLVPFRQQCGLLHLHCPLHHSCSYPPLDLYLLLLLWPTCTAMLRSSHQSTCRMPYARGLPMLSSLRPSRYAQILSLGLGRLPTGAFWKWPTLEKCAPSWFPFPTDLQRLLSFGTSSMFRSRISRILSPCVVVRAKLELTGQSLSAARVLSPSS